MEVYLTENISINSKKDKNKKIKLRNFYIKDIVAIVVYFILLIIVFIMTLFILGKFKNKKIYKSLSELS